MIVSAVTTFDVGFGVFVLAMAVLVIAVVRFAIRQDRIVKGRRAEPDDERHPDSGSDTTSRR